MRRIVTMLAVAAALAALAAMLGGCSKCDPWWGDKPAACHSDIPVR